MAQNYLQSSFKISLTMRGKDNTNEVDYDASDVLDIINAWLLDDENPADLKNLRDRERACFARLNDCVKQHLEESLSDLFGCDIRNTDTGCDVFFYHDDYKSDSGLDLDAAILVAQVLLDLNENDSVCYATWCYSCSKPRTDEFGGGMTVFNRHSEVSEGSNDSLRERLTAELLSQNKQ